MLKTKQQWAVTSPPTDVQFVKISFNIYFKKKSGFLWPIK